MHIEYRVCVILNINCESNCHVTDTIVSFKMEKIGDSDDKDIEIKVVRGLKNSDLKASLEVWKSLQHENIVSLKDYTISDNQATIRLHTGQHMTLRHMILYYSRQPASTPSILAMIHAYQMIRGLAYLRIKNVVHGNIGSQSVVVCKYDQRLKISCLDVAAKVGCGGFQKIPDGEDMWYAAPELYVSGSYRSLASDIWAIGCIISEMILQRPIFRDHKSTAGLITIAEVIGEKDVPDNIKSLLYNEKLKISNKKETIINNDLSSVFPKDTDPKLVDLISLCLQWHPDRRIKATEAVVHEYFKRIYIQKIRINEKDIATLTSFNAVEQACYEDGIKNLVKPSPKSSSKSIK